QVSDHARVRQHRLGQRRATAAARHETSQPPAHVAPQWLVAGTETHESLIDDPRVDLVRVDHHDPYARITQRREFRQAAFAEIPYVGRSGLHTLAVIHRREQDERVGTSGWMRAIIPGDNHVVYRHVS